jgi:CRP-like cAMP-binding protein
MQAGEPVLMPIVRKLERSGPLDDGDRAELLALAQEATTLDADARIARDGEPVDRCCALLSGFAYRSKITGEDKRQIVSLHLRGDLLDLHGLMTGTADHDIRTLTPCRVAFIPRAPLLDLLDRRPAIARAFWLDTLVDASVFREWILNVGRRGARTRLAHLLCETTVRVAGLDADPASALPLTQGQLADATGLTPAHVNRVLQSLVQDRLIAREDGAITVLDLPRLATVGKFDPAYLHPELQPLAAG